MSKNKVKERCQKEEYAKFYYGSQKMFSHLKWSRGLLYALAIIPVVLAFIPAVSTKYILVCSVISFGLSLLNESLTSFFTEYKKKAVMEFQLFETGITGTEFSKIEYDRETTNELNELAIRKGLPQMRGREKYYTLDVPEDISDEYSYLYLCRRSAATTKYLLSRMFYVYFCLLITVVVCFVLAIIFRDQSSEYILTLIITFFPLVSPIIKACGKCKECMKNCTKMCADIDNYFADGDISLERLARMHYYVQNLEFEMMTNRPTVYNVFNRLFKKGVADLQEGVTVRYKAAIVELKEKSMMHKGIIAQPKGRSLITKVDYDLDKLTKIEKGKKRSAAKSSAGAAGSANVAAKTSAKSEAAATTATPSRSTNAPRHSKPATKPTAKTAPKKKAPTKTKKKK